MSADKVVQTELPEEEYERLRRVAEQEERPLKEVLREAAIEYTRSHGRLDPDDPFFTYEPSEESEESLTATKTDEYLYGDE